MNKDRFEALRTLPLEAQLERYSELAHKVMMLAVMTVDELEEQVLLRDMLQRAAAIKNPLQKTSDQS